MKRLLLIMGVLCAGSAWGARTAFQIRCEDTIGKTVSILTAKQNGYTVINALSYHTLSEMKSSGHANAFVLGLTKTESRVEIGLKGQLLQDSASGYECIAPQINVSLYYLPIVIYVGREFAPGTCAYREILAHEMRHLNTYVDHLPKVELLVRAALTKRFEARPLYAPAGQAKALLDQEFDTGWFPYIRAEMAKVELKQSAIDSPAEYHRLSEVCKGEVQSIIGPAYRATK